MGAEFLLALALFSERSLVYARGPIQSRLNAWARTNLGTLPLDQVASHVASLKRRAETYGDTGEAPDLLFGGQLTRQQTAQFGPWMLAAMEGVARHLLSWQGGRLGLRRGAVLDFQDATKRVLPDQLMCFVWARHALKGDNPIGRRRELADSSLRAQIHSTLLPRSAQQGVEHVVRQGLAEVHRHDSLSRLPLLLWCDLLEDCSEVLHRLDTSDDYEIPGMGGGTARILLQHVRAARELRSRLLDELLGVRSVASQGGVGRLVEELAMAESVKTHQSVRLSGRLNPAGRRDRAADLPGGEGRAPFGERALLVACWRHLGGSNTEFQLAFHSYLAIQNFAVRALTQPHQGVEGFERFERYYVRSVMHELGDERRYQQIVQAWRTGCVRWLEVKVTPAKADAKVRRLLKGADPDRGRPIDRMLSGPQVGEPPHSHKRFLYQDRQRARPAIGVVLHFIRRRDSTFAGLDSGLPLLPRHHELRVGAWRQAKNIRRLLRNPELGPYVVGLDVANAEIRCGIEVFAPALRTLRMPFVREPVVEGWGQPSSSALAEQPVGLCCHAGEDFRSILSGIRMVRETINFAEYRTGDRIGHGLALGLDWSDWSERMGGSVIQPVGERLDDLVVFRAHLMQLSGHEPLVTQITDEIGKLAEQVYGAMTEPNQLERAWRMRKEDPRLLEDVHGFRAAALLVVSERQMLLDSLQRSRQQQGAQAWELWKRYHLDPRVRERYLKTHEFHVDVDWVDGVQAVQDSILEEMVASGIAIEINPSSNLSIGPFSELTDHPIFRWVSPRPAEQSSPRPYVTVGTDNPAIFATELAQEYAYLAAAAEQLGYSPREIQHWLQELRDNSIRFSFLPGANGGAHACSAKPI